MKILRFIICLVSLCLVLLVLPFIFLAIKGIVLYETFILLFGLVLILVLSFYSTYKKISKVYFILPLLLIVIGFGLVIYRSFSIEYISYLPEEYNNYYDVQTYLVDVKDKITVYLDDDDYTVVVDDAIAPGKIFLAINYYTNYGLYSLSTADPKNNIYDLGEDEFKSGKIKYELFLDILDNLVNEKKYYNYDLLEEKIMIRYNSKDKDKINIREGF